VQVQAANPSADAATAALLTPLAPAAAVSALKSPGASTGLPVTTPPLAVKPAVRPAKVVSVPKLKLNRVAPVQPEVRSTPALQLPSMPAPGLPPQIAMAMPSAIPAAQAEGPRAFAPATAAVQAPAASAGPPQAPVSARPVRAPETGPTVVAASGTKVWIRLDERRTVSVDKGQSLEGYGALIGVTKGVAKFERGSIASKTD
jgi:hypothetical protein